MFSLKANTVVGQVCNLIDFDFNFISIFTSDRSLWPEIR